MMRTAVSVNGNAHSNVGQGLLVFFYKCVSKHAKHVIFIASLHGQFNHYAKSRRMAVDKLNKVIDLAYRPSALEFPEKLHARVWNGTGVNEIATEEAIVNADSEEAVLNLATKIVDISPSWSRYASKEEMVNDTAEWIRSQHDHIREAA